MKTTLIFIISLLIPGSGHLLQKRFKGALLGFAIFTLEALAFMMIMLPFFELFYVRHVTGDYAGTATIGALPYVNNSFTIMVSSVIYFFLLLIFLFIHFVFARDAQSYAKQMKELGYAVDTKTKLLEMQADIVPNLITAPKFIIIFIFTLMPIIVSLLIAFTNYRRPILPPSFLIEWRGLENFSNLITNPQMSSLFTDTLIWTVVWTFSASSLAIAIGVILAVVANGKQIRAKRLFRTIYVLPWAVPAFLTILIFRIFFSRIGAMNTMVIPFFTGQPYEVGTAIGFLMDPMLARVTIISIQAWLGFPYMFALTTGVLQAIPDDLYEAGALDGGNAFTNFIDITLPLIFRSISPVFIAHFIFNFNNVVILYLLAGSVVREIGADFGPLETVASLGFRLMLDARFNEAAVFMLITSAVVGVIAVLMWMRTGAFRNEEVM